MKLAKQVSVRDWRDAVWSSGLTPTEKLVALAVADHAALHGQEVHPGCGDLRRATGLGRTAVMTARRTLVVREWLVLTSPSRQHLPPGILLCLPNGSVS